MANPKKCACICPSVGYRKALARCALLHLCYGYPNRTPFDELELEEVMDALQKYCMENGKKALTEQLKNAGLTKRGPVKLKLLAMARRHDWHDLILVLARQLLFLSTQELTTLDVTSDPTLTVKDYQQFLDYHLRCSQLAERMLSLDSGKLVLSSIADNCLSCKQKYGFRLSFINEPTLWCHRWVRDFVSTLLERVKVAPLGGVVLDDTLVNAITRMALLECETQTPFGARQTMETIVDVVRCAVNDVPFIREPEKYVSPAVASCLPSDAYSISHQNPPTILFGPRRARNSIQERLLRSPRWNAGLPLTTMAKFQCL